MLQLASYPNPEPASNRAPIALGEVPVSPDYPAIAQRVPRIVYCKRCGAREKVYQKTGSPRPKLCTACRRGRGPKPPATIARVAA